MGWEFAPFPHKEIPILCVGDLIKGTQNDKKMTYLILTDEGLTIPGPSIHSEPPVSGTDRGFTSLTITSNGLPTTALPSVCKQKQKQVRANILCFGQCKIFVWSNKWNQPWVLNLAVPRGIFPALDRLERFLWRSPWHKGIYDCRRPVSSDTLSLLDSKMKQNLKLINKLHVLLEFDYNSKMYHYWIVAFWLKKSFSYTLLSKL